MRKEEGCSKIPYPILELLPQAEYFDIISSCSSAVFGQRRQEARGNIHTSKFGSKSFLREENSLYSFLRVGDIIYIPLSVI